MLQDGFEPSKPGWSFLPEMDRQRADVVVQKTLNDPFVRTDLQATLKKLVPDRVLVAGWATDDLRLCRECAVSDGICRRPLPVETIAQHSAKPAILPGELHITKPESDKLPAVILAHGPGGNSALHDRWVQELNSIEVAI
jgi:hypothetical protein